MGLVLCAAIPDSHRKVFYEERRESRSRGGPNGQETVFTKRAIVHSASAKKTTWGSRCCQQDARRALPQFTAPGEESNLLHVTAHPAFAQSLVFWLSAPMDPGMTFAAHIQLLTGVSSAGSSKEEQVLRAWARFGFI